MFSTPSKNATPKSQLSSMAQSSGSSPGISHPASTFASGKPYPPAGTSAQSLTTEKVSRTTSQLTPLSAAQSSQPKASSPGGSPASIPSSHVSTSGSPATTLPSTPGSNTNPAQSSHGGSSGTDLPDSTAPSSTGAVDPTQTSDSTIFPVIFGGLFKNRKTVLDDDKHKSDYVDQIKTAKAQIKSYLDDLPDKPDTSSVGCTGDKHKRGLLSDIGSFAGNIGKLVTCADQVLDNLDGVVKGEHPSIKDIDTLSGAINVIGEDINKDNQDNHQSSAKQSAQSTTQPASTHSATTTTQPQSSCTQTAVSRCTEILSISTSYFASSSGSTVLTSTTTSCVTTSVCSGTATTMTTTQSGTSAPTETNRPLIILRNMNQTDQSAINSFAQQLADQVGASNVRTISGTTQLGIVFWTAPLNSSQIEEFKKSSAVSDILEDKPLKTTGWAPVNQSSSYPPSQNTDTTGNSKRADGSRLISQDDALASLRVVSQPHNVTIIDLTDNYKYNSAGGSGITVYVIDSGANPQNPEYISMPGSKRWLFPSGAAATQTDELNHGSCVLSKVAGPRYGVAKNADVVIVKVPTGPGIVDALMDSSVLDMWTRVGKDIQENNLQGKAVINFSGGGFHPLTLSYLAVLRDILRMDIPVVCTAGNGGANNAITHFPAAYADSNRYDGVIVVGASNDDGVPMYFSQTGGHVSVYAPGWNITCASNNGNNIVRLAGTSMAAPAVAGLAAYFMSMPDFQAEIQQPGQVAKNVKGLITRLAYPRHGNVPVLWNRENGDSCVNFQRRDGSSAKACSARASSILSSMSKSSSSHGSTKPVSTKPASTKPVSKKITTSDGPLETTHHTQPPPITLCSSVSAPAKTIPGTTFTETSYCTCNGGWMLGIGSTIGTDHSTTYTCEAGTKTTIAMSTKAPITTNSQIPAGLCIAQVEQDLGQSTKDPAVSLAVNITSPTGAYLGSASGNLDWTEKFNVDSELPWVLVLTPTTGESDNDGKGWKPGYGQSPNRPKWHGPLDFAYSRISWTSDSDQCITEKYHGLTRHMNCTWQCP
ncbi:Sexual differentiation process putative subtilase-type proteinase isp6 [Talaromyces islandicus]|uniref:Sexual differentiation process putative subtilase-type proteinase isp6 n=1 Tax=Talaromyces islandicus TaxID=28573 RepID=A0A0U1LMJ2_TALIS|nr:Sexual differentiation process putative subtilase-type proteinase isp6 [Talaromyces islandicus]